MEFDALQQRQEKIVQLLLKPQLDEELVSELGGSKRWKTYRHMVRTRLSNMIESGLPRTFSTLGTEATKPLITQWFENGGMTSAYIRDAVPSFYAATRWQDLCTEARPWIDELACYETRLWQLRHMEVDEQAVVDFSFEGVPAVNAASEVLDLEYPVYRLDHANFQKEPKQVLVFRHMLTDKVGYLTLTDFQRTLFDHCKAGKAPMTGCVQAAAQTHGLPIDESLLERVSSFLAELMSRTIVIGNRSGA